MLFFRKAKGHFIDFLCQNVDHLMVFHLIKGIRRQQLAVYPDMYQCLAGEPESNAEGKERTNSAFGLLGDFPRSIEERDVDEYDDESHHNAKLLKQGSVGVVGGVFGKTVFDDASSWTGRVEAGTRDGCPRKDHLVAISLVVVFGEIVPPTAYERVETANVVQLAAFYQNGERYNACNCEGYDDENSSPLELSDKKDGDAGAKEDDGGGHVAEPPATTFKHSKAKEKIQSISSVDEAKRILDALCDLGLDSILNIILK